VKEKLWHIWGYFGHNSKVPKPLFNLVLLLDESLNMKPNGNDKKSFDP
jgi:hypothetical protein